VGLNGVDYHVCNANDRFDGGCNGGSKSKQQK